MGVGGVTGRVGMEAKYGGGTTRIRHLDINQGEGLRESFSESCGGFTKGRNFAKVAGLGREWRPQSERGPLRYAGEITISQENDLSGAKIAHIPPFHCPLPRKRTNRSDCDRRAERAKEKSQLGVILSRNFCKRCGVLVPGRIMDGGIRGGCHVDAMRTLLVCLE
jgi:hypothetical protein